MNYKFSQFLIVAMLLMAVGLPVHAQQTNGREDDSTMIYDGEDSADIVEDIVPDTSIAKNTFGNGNDSTQKWKNSADFAYIKNLDSLLRKGIGLKADTVSIDKNTDKKRAAPTASSTNSNSLLNSFPVKIFFWAMAILFIGFIIYKLFFTAVFFAKANTKVASQQIEDASSALNEYSAYNSFIREAEQKKDFNLSVRYLYLQTLRRLADRDLIRFSPDKTNYGYVKELSGRPYQQAFASLTLNYEYVWYGKFVIAENHYSQLKEEFISFNKKM